MTSEIELLRQAALAIRDGDDALKCAEVLIILNGMKQAIKRCEGDIKQRLLEWCITNQKRIDLPDDTYKYAGFDTDTVCNDIPAALEALIEAMGGDVRGLVDVLCSEPIKYGKAREILAPEVFARLFQVTKIDKLKDGKSAKKLMTGSTKFEKH